MQVNDSLAVSGYHEEPCTPRRSVRLRNCSQVSYANSLRRTATPFRIKRKTSTVRKEKHISFSEQAQKISNSFIETDELQDDKTLMSEVKKIEDENAPPEILNTTFDVEEPENPGNKDVSHSPGKDVSFVHTSVSEIEQSNPELNCSDGPSSSEKSDFETLDYKEMFRDNQANNTNQESLIIVSEDESTLVITVENTSEDRIQSEKTTSNISFVLNQKNQEDCNPTNDQKIESPSEDEKIVDMKNVSSSTSVRFQSGEDIMALKSVTPILDLNGTDMTPVKIGSKCPLPRKKTPYHNKTNLKQLSGVTKRANVSKTAKRAAGVLKLITPDVAAEILASDIVHKNDTIKDISLARNQQLSKLKSNLPTIRRKKHTEADAKQKSRIPKINSEKKPGSPNALRHKMPNFSAIHQQNFVKMESIDEHIARKAERAKELTSVNKNKPGKSSVDDSKDNRPKARQKIDLSNVRNGNATPSKSHKANTEAINPKPVATVKPMDKVKSRQQKNMEMYKGKSGSDKKQQKTKDILRGVRSNRRFELQMQHRDRLKSQDKN